MKIFSGGEGVFTLFDPKKQRLPIKIWLKSVEEIETDCLNQALNLSNLPFAFQHIALMPDTHVGYGMPIGGVLATIDVIIPNAVGVDIGCGMSFVATDVEYKVLETTTRNGLTLKEHLVNKLLEKIPTGFSHRKKDVPSSLIDDFKTKAAKDKALVPNLVKELDAAYKQLGTLGGGNHFIEIQRDEEDKLCLMVHSGSRNIGYKIAETFNNIAKANYSKWAHPDFNTSSNLWYLPIDSKEGETYLRWLNFALSFARDNRALMQKIVLSKLEETLKLAGINSFSITMSANAHHNYAALEKHFGQNVWVHRKGAIRANKGEYGIVPGAMGRPSYIVSGLANSDAFNSAPHGAGRVLSRKAARRTFDAKELATELDKRGVLLGVSRVKNVIDEHFRAYKPIDEVMENAKDLVEPIKKVEAIAVIKGD